MKNNSDINDFITEWAELDSFIKKQKEKLKGKILREQELRREIFSRVFDESLEGVHKATCAAGELKATQYLDYKIDLDALAEAKGLPAGVIVMEPKLNRAAYKKLTSEGRKQVSRVLIIKPRMPSLELLK